MSRVDNSTDLHQKLAEFEQQNPKVAEAMRVFGISSEKYQGVLHAMKPIRTYVSNSTVSKDWDQNGR